MIGIATTPAWVLAMVLAIVVNTLEKIRKKEGPLTRREVDEILARFREIEPGSRLVSIELKAGYIFLTKEDGFRILMTRDLTIYRRAPKSADCTR